MKLFVLVALIPMALVLLFTPLARADGPTIEPWELLGAEDSLLNGICFSPGLLFATTEEGFHYFDFQTHQWTDRTSPGTIGMAKYAVVHSADLNQRLISGGMNAWFKGTLFYSDDMGQTETQVRESTGGRVTDMEIGVGYGTVIYACTLSDVADGEFLRSTDSGESWTLMTGHGHHAMTDLAVPNSNEVFLAGDNYVSHTLDRGETWTNLQHNLPVGQGIYCLLAPGPASGLPSLVKEESGTSLLLASNDTGVYKFDFETDLWELVLDSSCRALAHRTRQLDTFVFWSETYAVTWDHRVLFCLNMDWNNWQDVTGDLGPGFPIDIEANTGGVFVALQGGGVYVSPGHLYNSDVPDNRTQLQLTAFPNPFNPSTTIRFESPTDAHGVLQVFDLRGALVTTLFEGKVTAGPHTMNWRPTELGSGVYRVLFQSNGWTVSNPVVLLK